MLYTVYCILYMIYDMIIREYANTPRRRGRSIILVIYRVYCLVGVGMAASAA